ncbi:rhodanese-related sulfurtransferase [Blastomonas sp.]|uniref:oxygen-dependent tRNA uridine(34) hydroxylase TrhO n=1 Tax=Blastomonas sp. TaxID=1909299 RepID=UPI002602BF92|nr:rhodanese-related sulfurtransferase [Blastomonas sp.]MDM7955824.1 rhodanese-related sulfurtransferase [Blastomonas sp.]
MTDSPAYPITVAALYHFARIEDPAAVRAPIEALCAEHGLCGTLLLAQEGVNGTVAGTADGVAALIGHIRGLPGFADIEIKYSGAPIPPFRRMKVRLKREIVTMGVPDIDPVHGQGAYVDPADWNALISDPDTVVIDTRNSFEVEQGSFAHAIDPGTERFSDFPAWFDDQAEGLRESGKKIAMFCTGGIRCEKATAYVRAQGFDAVYQLKGGILKYLEDVPADESLFSGGCFVFDERVALGQGLSVLGDPVAPVMVDRKRKPRKRGVADVKN